MDRNYYHFGYIDREVALAVCPEIVCRRSGRCSRAGSELPCLKGYESLDEFRYRLAAKLDAMTLEAGGTLPPPGEERPLTYEEELKMAEFKKALWQADHDHTMQEMAAKRAQERKGKRRRRG